MSENHKTFSFALLIVVAVIPSLVFAECMPTEDGRSIKMEIAACQKISPTLDPSIKAKAGEMYETWQLEKLYTGALLSDASGQKWIYPSTDAEPCKAFPLGKTVEKAAYETCCDTGSWGKCVFGGNFLGDVGGKKINSFQ